MAPENTSYSDRIETKSNKYCKITQKLNVLIANLFCLHLTYRLFFHSPDRFISMLMFTLNAIVDIKFVFQTVFNIILFTCTPLCVHETLPSTTQFMYEKKKREIVPANKTPIYIYKSEFKSNTSVIPKINNLCNYAIQTQNHSITLTT